MNAEQSDARLAIDNGTPALSEPLPPMLPGLLMFDEEEERAALRVLRSRNLYRFMEEEGSTECSQLEGEFRHAMGTSFALAVTSGTAALLCALQGLGVGPGDEVIVPGFGWIASISAILGVGAVPVIVEVDDSLTIDPDAIRANLSPYTKAIMPIHMRGVPADMNAVLAIAEEKGLKVLEDTAQANGGSFGGRPLGALGDVGSFSLQASKIITTGEGGMVITDDEEIITRATMFHDPFSSRLVEVPEERVMWGMNFRMNEVTAAIARVQLAKRGRIVEAMRMRKSLIRDSLDGLAQAKGVTFRRLNDAAGDTGVCLVMFMPDIDAADRVSRALDAENVSANRLYAPGMVDQHVYASWNSVLNRRQWSDGGGPWTWSRREVEYAPDMCPQTLDLLNRSVQIHIHPTMSNAATEETIEGIAKVMTQLL